MFIFILDIDDLEIFENVAYIMAWHADPSIPGTIDEWLEDFEMFSIFLINPNLALIIKPLLQLFRVDKYPSPYSD